MDAIATVVLISDVHDIHKCLQGGAITGQFAMRQFTSADDALDLCEPQMPGCLVVDQLIRGASGLHVHEQLHAKGCQQPFIYVLRDADVLSAVEAMHLGAFDCVKRPLNYEGLLRRVREAIVENALARQRQAERSVVLARIESLTPREKQILEYVAGGELTKSIARLLEISPKTVEVHRSNITRKMHVESAAELFHVVAKHSLFPFALDVCRQ